MQSPTRVTNEVRCCRPWSTIKSHVCYAESWDFCLYWSMCWLGWIRYSVSSAFTMVFSVTCGWSLSLLIWDRATIGGSTRLELCGNLGIGGGTTPSIGLLRVIKKIIPDVQIMVVQILLNDSVKFTTPGHDTSPFRRFYLYRTWAGYHDGGHCIIQERKCCGCRLWCPFSRWHCWYCEE